MARFVLIPGAGGMASYWSRLVPELQGRGHEAVAVDLPGDDERAGLPEYADLVGAAVGSCDVVLVAQSMGGFTAPVVCRRAPVRRLVLVNAMIPLPGETPGEWWAATGAVEARVAAASSGGYSAEFTPDEYFLHDVPAEVLAAGGDEVRGEADVAFGQPCPIERWPDVPTTVIAGSGDRFFPPEFQRRVARERLGLETVMVPGGHLVALSRPLELAERLARL
jgi:pimeloyl-ACP methyl ester carboxylesterase